MIITQATTADAQEILDLQKLAYQSEAALYQDYTIAPLMQTLSEMTSEFYTRHFLKAVADGCIRGSVRAHLEDGTCYISRLIVHPANQNLGLGTQLMSKIEGCFADAQRYELFTGHLSERNLYLYRKLGYVAIRHEPVSEKLTLVFLEKKGKSCRSRGLLE